MKHLLLAINAALPLAGHAAGDANQKPNILFLFVDDLAYWAIHSMGQLLFSRRLRAAL